MAKVRAEVIADTTATTLTGYVKSNVADDSMVFTDWAAAYNTLRYNFEHGFTDHSLGEYVNAIIHTNGIEGFWALLERSIKGTYVAIAR
ncbi:MAG: transposase, partial [Verrucomicrobia bacterium]|nr:transposase [Verrucomicrobiota bacterium]